MSTYSFGVLYWLNPINKELEFIVARKYSKDLPLSLFYHDHEGFTDKLWGDTLGLIDSSSEELGYKIYEEVEPNLKTVVGGHNVYYIYINYVPELIDAMNGFRTYLDHCGTVQSYSGHDYKTIATCKKETYNISSVFYDFRILNADQISASLDQFNAQSRIALANFSTILATLKDFQKKGVQSHKMSSAEIQAQLKKNAELKIVNPMIYINELRTQHEDYQKKLLPKYKESIIYYTGSGYDIINKYLRGETTLPSSNEKTVLNHIANLNQVLNNAPPLTQSIFVYRGIKLDGVTKFQKLKEGDVIDLFRDNFNSTSFSLPISGHFAGNVCCLFMLHLPPGTKGLYVGKLSSYSNEDEFILAPGPFFEIIRYKNETVPIKNKWPTKPNLLTYRAACVDCETAYQKYNNIVYYKLVQPAFAVAKTPTTGMFKSPKQSPIDISGKIVTKKMTKVSTAMLKDPKALVQHSKFTKIDTKPKTAEELKAEKQKAEKQKAEQQKAEKEKAEKEKTEKIKELIKENEKLKSKAQQLSAQISLLGPNASELIDQLPNLAKIILWLDSIKPKYGSLVNQELNYQYQINNLVGYNHTIDDIAAQLEKFKKPQPSATQISTIEQKYLQGLSHEAIDELKKLADMCQHQTNNSLTHILNKITGKCVKISGAVGKKVIAELKSQYPMKAPTQPISPKPFPIWLKAQTAKELEVELIQQNDQLISQAQQLHKKIEALGEHDPSGLGIWLTLLQNNINELQADKSKYANFTKGELMTKKVTLDSQAKFIANINDQLENFIKTLPPTKPSSPKGQTAKELEAELIQQNDQLKSQAQQLYHKIKSFGSTMYLTHLQAIINELEYNKAIYADLTKDKLMGKKSHLNQIIIDLANINNKFEALTKTQPSSTKTISIPNIDSQHLLGLSPEALGELKKLSDQCAHYKNYYNKIMNKNGKCVNIYGAIGQQIISQLKSTYPLKSKETEKEVEKEKVQIVTTKIPIEHKAEKQQEINKLADELIKLNEDLTVQAQQLYKKIKSVTLNALISDLTSDKPTYASFANDAGVGQNLKINGLTSEKNKLNGVKKTLDQIHAQLEAEKQTANEPQSQGQLVDVDYDEFVADEKKLSNFLTELESTHEKLKAEKLQGQKAEKQKSEKLNEEKQQGIHQLIKKNEQLNSLAQKYINKILALGKNAPEGAADNLTLLNLIISGLDNAKSHYEELMVGEHPYEHQILNDIKTQIDNLGQEITAWKKIATGLGGPVYGHKAEKQKSEKLNEETQQGIHQLIKKNEQLKSIAEEYSNKIKTLGNNAPAGAAENVFLLKMLVAQLNDAKSQYAELMLGEIPHEHQILNDVKTQIDDLGQEITAWEKQFPPAPSTVYIPTIDSQYLQGLSTDALLQIQKMAFNCQYVNTIQLDDGVCWHIDYPKAHKAIEQLKAKYPIEAKTFATKSDISIPNIDSQYLNHLSQPVLIELKKLAEGCPHNKFKNPVTQTCVKIDGTVAKKIIKELIQKTQTQSPSKICGIPKNQPVVKKPLLPKKHPSDYVISPSDIISPLPTGLISNMPAAPQKIKIDKSPPDASPLPFTIHEEPSTKSKKSCSVKSKHAVDKDYICNPETGSWIKIGGSVYKKLLKKYTANELQEYSISNMK